MGIIVKIVLFNVIMVDQGTHQMVNVNVHVLKNLQELIVIPAKIHGVKMVEALTIILQRALVLALPVVFGVVLIVQFVKSQVVRTVVN